MTFSASSTAACSVKTDGAAFDVFPDKPSKDGWCLLSHPEELLENKKIVSWPGEYDFGGVTVRGIGQQEGKQVSYTCNTGGIRAAFVDAPVLAWSDAEIEKLGDIDVLVVKADDSKKVAALVEAVDPRVIVLLETKDGDLAGTAKAFGVASMEPVNEFKVKPGSLPTDTRQVVILK